MLQMLQFGTNTIGRGRGQSTSDRKRRARRWKMEFAFADQFSSRGVRAKLKLHFFYQNDAFFVV